MKPEPVKLRTLLLLKHNIDALLYVRQQTRQDLAMWVLRTHDKNRANSWISHIFGAAGRDKSEIQLKYFDRIADFFGRAAYELFLPGLSNQMERRTGERRQHGERRVRRAFADVTPPSADDLARRFVGLSDAERRKVDAWMDVLILQRESGPASTPPADPSGTTAPPSGGVQRARKRKAGDRQKSSPTTNAGA